MITLTTEQAQQIEEASARVEQSAEECMGDDGMVMVVPLDLYNELVESLVAIRAARAQEFTAEQQNRFATAFDEAFAKAGLPQKQAEQEPLMDYERINALREGEQNGAEDAYFFVRPENDTPTLRKMFCQGFERGFHKGLKYAAPVRAKDLTDTPENGELERLHGYID